MSIILAMISLIISGLAFLLSMSNIRVSIFKERYNIYFEARSLYLKLMQPWTEIVVNSQDVEDLETLRQKAEFMFGSDEDISNFFKELKGLFEYYASTSYKTIMEEASKPAGNRSSEMLVDHSTTHSQNLERIKAKIEKGDIENMFRYHLVVSYFPFSIINWKKIKRWFCKRHLRD